MPSGTGGMGRGSDTRMYNPRSESTRLFGYEDDETGYAHGYGDPEIAAAKNEKDKREKEETKNRQRLHHIKIKNKDVMQSVLPGEELAPGQEVTQEGDGEAPPKDEMQAELSQLTGASGSRGAELDQAVGAKTGTGSAMGGIPPLLGPQGVYRSQFLEEAWSELLKAPADVTPGSSDWFMYQPGGPGESPYWDDEEDDDFVPITPESHPELFNPTLEQAVEQIQYANEKNDEYYASIMNEMSPEMLHNHWYEDTMAITDWDNPDFWNYITDEQRDKYEDLLEEQGIHTYHQDGMWAPPSYRKHYDLWQQGVPVHEWDNAGDDNIQTGEPMDYAWSELLKYDNPEQPIITWLTPDKSMAWVNGHGPYTSESIYAALKEQGTWDNRVEEISDTYYTQHGLKNPKGEYEMPPIDANLHEQQAFQEEMFDEEGNLKLSEPMDLAWSLLKSKKKDKGEGAMAAGEIGSAGTTTQRRKEHAKKWAQPKFHGPPGGRRPWTGTSRRAKARSRTLSPRHRVHSIKGGLMGAPLAVHMSHLGVQTKQPMRQFPASYRQYYGQQLRRRLQGNVPLPYSPHALFGERTQYPGPTGGGRLGGTLPGQAAAANIPSLRRLARPRMPRLKPPTGFNPMTPPTVPSAPPLPQPAQVGLPSSSIQMSEDSSEGSDIQKNIMGPGSYGFAHAQDIKRLLRELREALDKRGRMKKAKDTAGAGEDKPDYPANSPRKTTKNEGGTETPPHDDARTWGMEPSAHVGAH